MEERVTYVTVTYPGVTSSGESLSWLPTPTCTVNNQADCSNVHSVFSSLTSSYIASVSPTMTHPEITFAPLIPPCTPDAQVLSCPTAIATGQTTVNCYAFGYGASLLYWPEKADPCTANNDTATSTVDPSPTPSTAVFKGITLTSPTALMILRTVEFATRTVDSRGFTLYASCGRSIRGSITVKVPDWALSTAYWKVTTTSGAGTTTTASGSRFNPAHMESPPWDNYYNAARCVTAKCDEGHSTKCASTIRPGYAPSLMVPRQITEVEGVPAGCSLGRQVYYAPTYIPITSDNMEPARETRWHSTVGSSGLSSRVGMRVSEDGPVETVAARLNALGAGEPKDRCFYTSRFSMR